MFKPLNSKRFNPPTQPFAPGPAPFLEWIDVERLVVDTEYQREIVLREHWNTRTGRLKRSEVPDRPASRHRLGSGYDAVGIYTVMPI